MSSAVQQSQSPSLPPPQDPQKKDPITKKTSDATRDQLHPHKSTAVKQAEQQMNTSLRVVVSPPSTSGKASPSHPDVPTIYFDDPNPAHQPDRLSPRFTAKKTPHPQTQKTDPRPPPSSTTERVAANALKSDRPRPRPHPHTPWT